MVPSVTSASSRSGKSPKDLLTYPDRLQELSLVNNPLKDNRLRKMCEQKGTKAVLDYIKANSGKEGKGGGKGGKKGKKGGKQLDTEEVEEVGELLNTLSILSFSEEYPEILVSDLVREVRKKCSPWWLFET